MFKRLALFAFSIAFTMTSALAAPPSGGMPPLPPQPKVRPAGMPTGYVMVSPCIQGMGEHWANLKDMSAPIYGTHNGKPIFSEIMVPLKTLNAGFNYPNLATLPGYKIDHVSIEYHPKGHEGMMIPHYDIHAYYITYAQQKAICPNGIPDPDAAAAMKMDKM
ncbi:MAG TPA: DUF5602 domain-containing protein [Candidatus Baltobacteraceae bacterium]|nr:DUF5602 domain-containing protein [Candidatus Baltobacteraceae bacterium]